jgi:hypothetical protein
VGRDPASAPVSTKPAWAGIRAAWQHIGVFPADREPRARMGAVSTRTLLVLAAICGMAILAATAIQILIAH